MISFNEELKLLTIDVLHQCEFQHFVHSPQLLQACYRGDVETVERLVSRGVDVNTDFQVHIFYLVSNNC